MLSSLLAFIGSSLILTSEGRIIVGIIASRSIAKSVAWALGYPIGVFLNVCIVFALTLLGIALTGVSIYGAHAVLLLVLIVIHLLRKSDNAALPRTEIPVFRLPRSTGNRLLLALLSLSILVKLVYGAGHALLLPTFYYDSLSQWTMRARISYEDRAIAFDENELRGISKPQYPILLHSLQIFSMIPHGEWNDTIANASTLLLTMALLTSISMMIAISSSGIAGVLFLALILMIPIMTMHLSQGYGDIHVVEYIVLSAVLLSTAVKKVAASVYDSLSPELLLSGLFIAAATWTKQEGLYFGLLPWLIFAIPFALRPSVKVNRMHTVLMILTVLILGGSWSAYLLTKGLPLSPHAGDSAISFHAIAPPLMRNALFASGSFGIFWYVIPLMFLTSLYSLRRVWKSHINALIVAGWGIVVFLLMAFVYVFTPNVQFLVNGQTFARTAMIPLALFILSACLLIPAKLTTLE